MSGSSTAAFEAELGDTVVAVSHRPTLRRALAHDASHYLLIPDAVVTPRTTEDVARVVAASQASRTPVTFRSGGTSLSGQAGTQSVLVDTRRHFRRIDVLDDGERVRVQPGATVRQVNARLARYGRKLGPDPASEIACTIGGVIANNSSGMACGTEQNTYRTLESLTVVLPSGTIIDTAAANADARLRTAEPDLHAGLLELRDRLRTDPTRVAEVRRQFAIKNTMGYSINALLDFDAPIDILTNLLVGSEGTLGFIAEAVFTTVPLLPHAATGLLVFPDLAAASASLPALVEAGFATIELMDALSLTVAQSESGCPAEIADIDVVDHAALLVEVHGATTAELDDRVRRIRGLLTGLPLASPVRLTRDAAARASLWQVRKGLYTAVAGARPSGTTALLEDIAVPVAELLPTCVGLVRLFDEFAYEGCVIFGHAKDGNIHFMVNERFDDAGAVERYRRFTERMVDLVLSHGGTLKAEHGTGRIMAPFVRRQYGDALYVLMLQIKQLFDPEGILNPGVVINEDPDSYLKHLKTTPTVETEVDRCVECGYCESSCPSRDLTLTPRQRIVLRREMEEARAAGDDDLLAALEADYEYEGEETCAVDGMCAVACPVDINTGDLVRRLRAERQGRLPNRVAAAASTTWGPITRGGGAALSAARRSTAVSTALTHVGRALLGTDRVPLYDRTLPRGGHPRKRLAGSAATDSVAVYFPACVGTMFGPEPGGTGVQDALLALAWRAGIGLHIPTGIDSACCGTPWKSKGFTEGYDHMSELTLGILLDATEGGRLPIVSDASSCTEGLELMTHSARARGVEFRVIDSVAFAEEFLLPNLVVTQRVGSAVVHPTCSTTVLGTTTALIDIARAVADRVVVPIDWGCCAFAGDRGMLHPELTATATAAEARAVVADDYDAYVSSNRTCEIGMTRATGQPYRHVLELLEVATRPLTNT
ncbi:FAD-binding and (Fe-S)-binding domain-containing protein [Leifsonia aquatica]|uniref:FAD-binding and (Fe-S)-binding domain-containing protein n=1 Tax=Leifsonia aquatica TaxID=144185 RepID=UPI00046A7E8F|nr:FAD-binding and (Fe-S)-binding domain-containing protein [Leifsonia aquatica]